MDYEKLYKDTINKLQEMVNSRKITVETARGICTDFVAESEDERIRKDIIWCLKHSGIKESNPINPHVTTIVKDAIAWLEKQGEQKLYVNDNAKEMFIKALERVEEQNNKGYKLTDCDKNSWWEDFKAYTSCTIEQKPAAWSEEDENMFENTIGLIEVLNRETKGAYITKKYIKYLKSLKDRIQPKQEWSEEDKEQLDRALYMMEQLDITKSWDDVYNWLKSLRFKNTWKPSDEQIAVLNEVINYAANSELQHWSSFIYTLLKSLREQLKKLMEE